MKIRVLKKKPVDEFSAAEEDAKEEKPSEIEDGPELLRILNLPKRPIPDPDSEAAQRLAAFLTGAMAKVGPTERLKNPPPDFKELGPYPGSLMPTQALCLKEGKTCRGGFFPIVVGGGKMLACYLMAALFMAEGLERIVYVCPGANVPDARREFGYFADSWKGPTLRQIRIVSYEEISNKANAEEVDAKGMIIKPGLLDRLRPQLLLFDEAHSLSNGGAAVTKRVKHYLKQQPTSICMAFTGTPFKETTRDCDHIMEWCLGEMSPLPRPSLRPTGFKESMAWSGYLSAKSGAFGRTGIGELIQLARQYDYSPNIWLDDADTKDEILHQMRRVVAQRILETPGVIGTRDAPLDIPLTIEPWYPVKECDQVNEAYDDLVETNMLPDQLVEQPDELSLTRHLSTIGLTFWSKWIPQPPDEWLQARQAWNKWCRRALRYNKNRITSEATLIAALGRGLYKSGVPIYQRWDAARKAYEAETGEKDPPSVPQWLGEGSEVVESVRAWVAKYGGLVWVSHIGLGNKLSAELGIPYYGAGGGKDVKTGRNIMQHPGGPAIASLDACGTGKNLQRLWSDNLWLCIPGEQSLARTHRKGQPAAVVRNFMYLGCGPHLDSFENAKDHKASFAEDMLLSAQKLRCADSSSMPSARQLERRGSKRWEPRP